MGRKGEKRKGGGRVASWLWMDAPVYLTAYYCITMRVTWSINSLPLSLYCNVFSERERSRSLYVVVRPSDVCLPVCNVLATAIFGNVSTPFGTLVIF